MGNFVKAWQRSQTSIGEITTYDLDSLWIERLIGVISSNYQILILFPKCSLNWMKSHEIKHKPSKICLLLGLCPRPRWGSLQCSPNPLVDWGGETFSILMCAPPRNISGSATEYNYQVLLLVFQTLVNSISLQMLWFLTNDSVLILHVLFKNGHSCLQWHDIWFIFLY